MKKLLVSLHDVTPGMFSRTRRVADIILERVGTEFTLLVVPDFHGSYRIDRYPDFCRWLRELHSMGVEVAQHGLYHLGGEPGGVFGEKLLTAGEGEFLYLSSDAAREHIETGFHVLSDVLGGAPSGFTAPAWLYSKGTREVLREFPFRWVEYRPAIDYSDGGRRFMPVIVFATRTAWKRRCSLFWASAGPALFAGFSVFRLALHVRDLPYLEEQLKKAIEASVSARTPVRCAALADDS